MILSARLIFLIMCNEKHILILNHSLHLKILIGIPTVIGISWNVSSWRFLVFVLCFGHRKQVPFEDLRRYANSPYFIMVEHEEWQTKEEETEIDMTKGEQRIGQLSILPTYPDFKNTKYVSPVGLHESQVIQIMHPDLFKSFYPDHNLSFVLRLYKEIIDCSGLCIPVYAMAKLWRSKTFNSKDYCLITEH